MLPVVVKKRQLLPKSSAENPGDSLALISFSGVPDRRIVLVFRTMAE
jgi:hypothetical protein